MIGVVAAFSHYLPRLKLSLITRQTKAQWENKIVSHLVPLFHLRDPHKTGQFSLEIWQYHFSKKLRKASIPLWKDGYAFAILKDKVLE